MTHKSGEERRVEYAPFRSGELEVWLVQDVTERERAERELQDREARMRSILDNASDGIMTIDEDGTVESFNAAAERMFGYQAAEIVGKNVELLMAPPHREQHAEDIRQFLETDERKVMGLGREVSGLRKDGTTFPLELGVSEPLPGDKKLFTGILRDLSERKRLESEFHQAQKLEAVGRLAGGIAHDFNNLLMGIIGCCRIAGSDIDSDSEGAEGRKQIMEIDAAARRGTTLTRQLLTFSRRRAVSPKPVRLGEVLRSSETLLRRLLGEDVLLNIEVPPSGGPVIADPGQLEQILMNLAVNARDAMPDGGELSMRIADAPPSDGRPERRVMLEVADTGCGMDEATSARAFEPFFTTKKEGEGTGLGLSTVYGIVKQLGGEIGLFSHPGRGTRIRIHLARAEDALFQDEPQEEAQAVRTGHETVLVVEDDRLVRAGVRHFLQAKGYEVLAAGNPTEATQICGEHQGRIDLVLTDVIMPGLGGPDLARRIQDQRPESRVLYMSALPRDLLVEQGRMAPNQPYIEKPFSDAELSARIRDVLDAG
jgi:PAS domain S-box-containing protein